MASERSMPAAKVMTVSLLIMMMMTSSSSVAAISFWCKTRCVVECIAVGPEYYDSCYFACITLRCIHPTLDSSYDLASDPAIQCDVGCTASKCWHPRTDVKKATGCATSCVMNCDREYGKN